MLYLSLFLCVFKDDSRKMVEGWREMLEVRGISLIISGHNSAQPKGGQASLQLLVTVPASQPHFGERSLQEEALGRVLGRAHACPSGRLSCWHAPLVT